MPPAEPVAGATQPMPGAALGYRLKRWSYHATSRLVGPDWMPALHPRDPATGASGPWFRSRGRLLARRLATRMWCVRHAVVDDLAAWCDQHEIPRRTLSPAQTRERRLPVSLDPEPQPNFERRRTARIQERFVVCLGGAKVWGANGLVVLPDGSFAAQAIYDRSHLENDPSYRTPLPRRAVAKRGDYFTLLGEFSNSGNYFHWVHDALLRLHGVDRSLLDEMKFLVPSPLLAHQRESLGLLGFRAEQLVPCSGTELWDVERLWFATLPPSGVEVPEALTWLRDTLRQAVGVSDSGPRRRLYLSRRATKHARVVNEAELAPILERHGFEIVEAGTLSVADQVRLFAHADAIVAPTGSAQTNLLFASPEVRNLEILEPRWAGEKAWVVWSVAEALGQEYAYFTAETVLSGKAAQERADLFVPLEPFERALTTFCGDR
jgi:capsular polysaccharide biosynthesis protein